MLHFTLEAAQASQDARSLALRSGTALEGCGAEVGEKIGAEVGKVGKGAAHSGGGGVKDMMRLCISRLVGERAQSAS